jgi:SMODS and SLOG-associating 2TM effector domain 1/SMODS and SLOG-associating 2TM effector domain 3
MKIEFPHIYGITNKRSADNQKYFLNCIMAEYVILIFTAVNSSIPYKDKYIINLILFSALMALLVVRNLINFERKWYKYRAVTESIKTTTWKFSMKAEPFNSDNDSHDLKNYIEYLENIIKDSKYAIKTVTLSTLEQGNFSVCLKNIRNMSYEQRRDLYVIQRITDQRDWYVNKSIYNQRFGRYWAIAIFILYGLSFAMTAYLAKESEQSTLIPTELITTILASLIGWVQIKKYNELSASYALTAHEIGLIKEQAFYISSESDFANFIRDAETAFSREHTQWQARRII